jgi:hypothetical protein
MRNDYSPWKELAALPHLELRREPPPDGCLGEYLHHRRLIRLHPDMPSRQARSVLCHELRHAEAGDVGHNLRQEWLADTRAARLLIDHRDLADAMVLHDQHRSAVAVELGVSLDMVEVRLKHLWRREWEYLRRRFD